MIRGVVLILLLLEGAARADDCLIRARQAVSVSDYIAARTALAAARDSGTCGPAESAELYKLSGIVAAALGNTEAAIEAFKRLLALSPRATLPPGTSPKIMRPFDAAASYYSTHAPLDIELEPGKEPGAFTLIVNDPVGLVDKVRLAYAIDDEAENTRDVAAAPRSEIQLPAGRRTRVRMLAVDAHGNHLLEESYRGERAPEVKIVVKPAPRPAPRRPIYLRWWPYAAATVVAGGATGYFGWSAYSTAQDLQRATSDRDARALEDRGQRATRFTNIGFGVTGAFAIATGVMYLIEPGRAAETRMTAVPIPGGGAMVVGGRF